MVCVRLDNDSAVAQFMFHIKFLMCIGKYCGIAILKGN